MGRNTLIASCVAFLVAESGIGVRGRLGRAVGLLDEDLEGMSLTGWQGYVLEVCPLCEGIPVGPLALSDVLIDCVQMLPFHLLKGLVFLVFGVPPRLRDDEVVELLSQLIEAYRASVLPQIRDF